MTKAAEELEKQVQQLRNEADVLEAQICEECEGTGEVVARERIHSQSIDVPYKTCPECNGKGIK